MRRIFVVVRVNKPSRNTKRLVMIRDSFFTKEFSPLHRKVAEVEC